MAKKKPAGKKKKYEYGDRYSKEKKSPYRDMEGRLYDPHEAPKTEVFYGLSHIDLDNDTKVDPESIGSFGNEHKSRRFPTRGKPPEEVFNDPEKKKKWDEYWADQDRWWADVLYEEDYKKKGQDRLKGNKGG